MPKLTVSKFAVIDDVLAATPGFTPVQCRICRYLNDPETEAVDAAYVAGLLSNPEKTGAHIARVLTEGGVKITDSSVKRHRSHQ